MKHDKGRRRIGRIGLIAWFAIMLSIGAGLLAKHVVAMPAPSAARLAPSMTALRTPAQQGKWMAVHVLYSECRCSQRIVAHLVSTTRPADWAEVVLWVGAGAPSDELTARFDLRHISVADLTTYGIEAAPSLIVVDPTGRVLYAGGYTDRKQGPSIDDLRIMQASRDGASVAALPLFGCAVSERLKANLALLPTP